MPRQANLLMYLLLTTLLVWLASHVNAAPLDDHVAALRARAAKLQNITIRFDMTEICTPTAKQRELIKALNERSVTGRVSIRDGTYVTQETFRRNGPDMRFTSVIVSGPSPMHGHSDFASRTESATVDGKLEHATFTPAGRAVHAIRVTRMPKSIVDVAIGIRDQWHNDPLDPATAIIPANVRTTEDNKVELTVTDEKGIQHIWTYDPDNDYAIEKFRAVAPALGWPQFVMHMSKFKKVEGVTLPMSIVETFHIDEGGASVLTRTRTVTITEYKLNDPDNTPDKLRIAKPKP